VLADDRLPAPPGQRYLLQAVHYATAKVRIDGRSYFFRYSIQPDTGTIDPSHGHHLIGQGRLAIDYLSPWQAWVSGQPAVFRLGQRYVATTAVDAKTRTVVIETKTASDYRRLELSRGLLIPDFSFYDSKQRTYRLSDFRGRFVLINVWYPGCGPCEEQLPYLRASAARFGHTDLTILGFSQGYPRVGRLWDISPTSPPEWIEAEPQSVRHLIDHWFQITATPTPILLDRDGRIAVLERRTQGERPLSGDELLRTLERVIRRSPAR
jgi:thiol-disulfide isomerase/thioredoxin